jgi:uncharacterized protein
MNDKRVVDLTDKQLDALLSDFTTSTCDQLASELDLQTGLRRVKDHYTDGVVPARIKIVVTGGFGVGKTTLIATLSDVHSLHTEETMTAASVDADVLDDAKGKTTTVALDFGRVALDASAVIYMFGTPGQGRFSFLWDGLTHGAQGAIVLVDTRRIEDSFASINYFESCGLPFIVAVNCFDGMAPYAPADVRDALDVGTDVPVMLCDARERGSVKQVMVELVSHVLEPEFSEV